MSETDPNTSRKLALIYSKLAELELHQKDKASDSVWKEIVKKCSAKDLDISVINDIETIFYDSVKNPESHIYTKRADETKPEEKETKEAGSSAETETGEDEIQVNPVLASYASILTSSSINNIRLLFLAETQFSFTLKESISTKLKNQKSLASSYSKLIPDILSLREENMKIDKKLNDYEELCRNLQKLSKEKDDQRSLIISSEQSKTQHLENECLSSIETVTKKIEEEETDLSNTENENKDLQGKLESFMIHLKLKKEKLKNEEKTKDLYFRLKEAKKQQALYYLEQQKMKNHSIYSSTLHSKETIHQLSEQLKSFSSKFLEFEKTLEKSSFVIDKVCERENALSEMNSKLKEDYDLLKKKVKESDYLIISTIEKKRESENEINALKVNYEKIEKKCRKLLMKRQNLMKDYGFDDSTLLDKSQNTGLNNGSIAAGSIASGSASSSSGSSSSSSGSSATTTSTVPKKRSEEKEEDDRKEYEEKMMNASERERLKTPSPSGQPSSSSSSNSSSNEKLSTPGRRIHHFVLSSSSATSPSRQGTTDETLVGDGSPVGSPVMRSNKSV
jgi:hypothetical protein